MPRKSGQKGYKLSATTPPPKNTSSDEEGADGDKETSEILKKLEQFRAETAGNFNELKQEIHIERAHRATGVSAGRKEQARSIIVRFRSYKEKQRVLQAAWSKKDIRIYFDEDFTADVYRERTMYRSVRKQLQERNIKLYLQDGKTKTFVTPREAADGLQEFGVTMEASQKEPDWETALRAAGWHSPRSRSRRVPFGEVTASVTTLRQSLDKYGMDKTKDK
ncbi:hypothetical protein DPX16_12081 [Anabarilius grahami]|uniref:LINE-1 type transposase domain-containing protein 1 n=1 Tax=Anabarilius grahami TaxID=495550 RepID=A0A3N0YYS4_ANAGA|nr:hypothetical protein DPX16_12081 [Anabarilius grahami]